MSSIRLSGSSSGYYDLTVPAAAGTNSIDLSNLVVDNTAASLTGPLTVSGDIIRNDTTTGTMKFALQYNGADAAVFKRNNTTGVATISNGYAGAAVDSLNIDLAGRITTPNQPCFDVASNQGVAANNYQTFNTQYHNVGNHFSLANNRFTAPVNGLYQFFATTIKSGAASGSVTRVYIYVNGSIANGNRHVRLSEGSNYGTNGVGSWIISMSAGDYAQVYISSGGSHSSTEYTYFNGYLLQ